MILLSGQRGMSSFCSSIMAVDGSFLRSSSLNYCS